MEESQTIQVPKAQLTELLKQNAEYKEKEAIIADVCFKAMRTIGLIDETTGEMKPEVKEGNNVFGIMIKTIKEKISIMDYWANRKKFEADLAEQFSFLQPLLKIGQDYASRGK